MTIVCDTCATRYSISDERVRGKVFKIRCKRCNQVTVVGAGNTLAETPCAGETAEEQPGPGADPGADGRLWHLAVRGEQLGPLSAAEVLSRCADGEVDAESFAWREGFEDWRRLGTLPEFADLLLSPIAPAPPVAPAPPAPAPLGPDSAPEAAGGRLTDQRNESSLLFSLDNLQSLAARPLSGVAGAAPGRAGARGDGSGLLDLRALAVQTLATAQAEDLASSPAPGGLDPILSPVVSLPVLMPAQPTAAPGWVWGAMGGLVALLGVTAAGIWLYARQGTPVVVARADPAGPSVALPIAPASTAQAAPALPTAPAPAPAPPAVEGRAAPRHRPEAPGRRLAREARPAASPPRGSAPASPAQSTPPPSAPIAARAPGRPRPHDEIDDLLNQASPDHPATRHSPERRPAEEADLPEQLPRADILAGMRSVQSQVDACAGRHQVSGYAHTVVVLAGAGKAQSVRVLGPLAGTPAGECVEKAVQAASFKHFKGAPISLNYPFILRH